MTALPLRRMTSLPRMTSLVRLLIVTALAVALMLTMVGPLATLASAATKKPAVPSGLPAGIEAPAPYVPANSCSPTTRPGAAKLGKLLTSTYPGTTWGGARGCGLLPDSEHHDGRAVDWMNNVRNRQQKDQAKAVISWLLATDDRGNPFANARRLGIMYIIWDNKIWASYRTDDGWRPYSSCASHPEKSWDNTCHRNHMHLSLSWAGAMGRTSFWTKSVAATDYGRCQPADLNWAYPYDKPNPVRCPRVGVVHPPKGASSLLKTLTSYSGRHLKVGHSGGAVTAIQKAVKTKATGNYTESTKTAVQKWQRAHKIKATGTINHTTWRALLKAHAPR